MRRPALEIVRGRGVCLFRHDHCAFFGALIVSLKEREGQSAQRACVTREYYSSRDDNVIKKIKPRQSLKLPGLDLILFDVVSDQTCLRFTRQTTQEMDGLCVEGLALSVDCLVLHIILEIHVLVNRAIRSNLNDTVADRADELVVMAGHEDIARI